MIARPLLTFALTPLLHMPIHPTRQWPCGERGLIMVASDVCMPEPYIWHPSAAQGPARQLMTSEGCHTTGEEIFKMCSMANMGLGTWIEA
ncbi:uncharacterized protein EI90DRAFT_1509937 [Cantharellus anzutake]|uniref:uncharacterized protein n=1 Tax=Cantharellus anzutake TaxID=1750568 RepID=UPI001904D375|nr:uncharacterized protein EI90DRAFT_1509937 [Cantharellus anzutake]KAF8328657.1 hypothetical protein EI90DRAFT_1509937 [Cantharellus anzutake]